MAEIVAAVDQQGANILLDTAIASLGPQSDTFAEALGPFSVSGSVSAMLVNGDVDLIPPDIIRIVDLRANWHIALHIAIDLGAIMPEICLPRVCIPIPCVGTVCTPRICLEWPTIPVNLPFGDFVETTGDFRLEFGLTGGVWKVEAVILNLSELRFGPATAGLLAAIGAALTLALLPIPIFGAIAAIAVNVFLLTVGTAGVTGLLGPILTPFISGLRIPIYEHSRVFEMLPAEGPFDPKVDFNIDLVAASVANSGGEDELVLIADISP
jgi:hypothetical protein